MSKKQIPPAVQEIWKSFVTTASGKDSQQTITSSDLLENEATKAFVSAAAAPAVSVSELPSVPVTPASTNRGEPVATDFEVRGVLGEGGMGRVLLARQKSLQRDVALKVLKGNEPRTDVVATLLAEAVITGSIEHPSIVPVHALGRDKNGLPVLVMKRIDGVSWRHLFQNPDHPVWASLAVDAADRFDAHLEILMSVCNAVHYAHSRGIVHRDIKLDNVMIGGFGEVYLVDWGIAMRMSGASEHPRTSEEFEMPVGTLAYMAPEMAMGDVARIDARTDVYLLGATLHYLLVGKPRHVGGSPFDLLVSARDSEPFDYGPTVSAELAAICNRAMHVDPEKRFSSALELRQALASYRRHRGSLALATKAFAKMAEMEQLKDLSERRMRSAMTECRFAFMQALEAWSGNDSAREGLDQLLARMIDYEIGRRDVEEARALFAELSRERPDLSKKIDELAMDVERENAQAARLQALARDTDIRIGARFQFFIIGMLPLYAILSFVFMHAANTIDRYPTEQLLGFPILTLLLLAAVYFPVRKRFTTSISRRAFAVLCLFPTSLLVHRSFALTQGDSIVSIFITDLAFSSILALIFAITTMPPAAWTSGIFLIGALSLVFFPEYHVGVFIATCALATLIVAVLFLRISKTEKEMNDRPPLRRMSS